ncbi:MAG: molybdopterin oxidoreductase [Bacteroidetes bacterium]|nr:MAG: molybdopterin oxidoreductase [Bacteroidota bacterium]
MKGKKKQIPAPKIDGKAVRPSRRDFLKTTAFLGGSTALLATAGCSLTREKNWPKNPGASAYGLHKPENQILTSCLQCHTACPIKVKLQNGVAVKIDGNPYSPQTLTRQLDYEWSPLTTAPIDGAICPKGQAGIQSLYDPYRLVKVLKRAGKRGENKWQTISFDQALDEITNGGKLFAHVPGEENRHVPGLKELFRMRDPKLMKQMAADAKAVGKGKMSREAFKEKYKDHLELLIDPERPDLGPINNQFVFLAGRIEHGRKEFAKRWLNGGFGSVNWYEHTTVCEQSHHIAYEKMTDQYKDGKWSGGKHHMKPDLHNVEFILFFGTSPFEANFGPPMASPLMTKGLTEGRLKFAVVDPRLTKTAAKAWKWLPIKPGSDAACAHAIAHYLLEHGLYDERFLSNANRAAAEADQETVYTNSSWLVKIEEDGPGALLRASEIGLGDEHTFVVMRDGRPRAVRLDSETPVEGDLFFAGEIQGIKVKTSFQVYYDYVMSKTLEEWAGYTGIEPEKIKAVAAEYARHGKKAVVEFYRGPVQHTNGYYNGTALIALNLLNGNVGWKGGLTSGGGHWHEVGDKPGQPFNLKALHPGKLNPFGHKLTKEGTRYEDSTYFQDEGYPARRPWYPFTNNVYQEVLPAARAGYPYPIKAVFLHKGTPALSLPGAQTQIDALLDVEAIPLTFQCDIVIGDTTVYADYVFPDMSIWERWGTPHTTPAVPTKCSKIRQPAVAPLVETCKVFGNEMPISMEAIMLGIAERLGMPGFGDDGFAEGMPLKRPEDYFLKMIANIAAGDKPGDSVPDADEQEMTLFVQARRHLPETVFDPTRWEKAVIDAQGGNWWRKVVYVLVRGGRFEDFTAYENSGDKLPHPFKGLFSLYVEEVAEGRHPYTGERFKGYPVFEPPKGYNDQPLDDGEEFPYPLITYKPILGGQSRTLPNNYWLSNIMPQNYILMNKRTAAAIGIKEGDTIRLISATNPEGIWNLGNEKRIPVEGEVKLAESIRPGVIAVSWSFGHWGYGAGDTLIDGQVIEGEPERKRGLCPNAVFRTDPVLKDVCLSDLIGGSTSFFQTKVKVEPARAEV